MSRTSASLVATIAALTVVGLVSGPSAIAAPAGGAKALARDGATTLTRLPTRVSSAADDAVVANKVLVRWKAGVSTGSRRIVRADVGVRSLRTLPLVPRAESVAVPAGATVNETVAALRADPRVATAQPVFRYRAMTDSYEPNQWGLSNTGQVPEQGYSSAGAPGVDVNAQGAWALPSGTGSASTVVAVIDTGVDIAHPDLSAGIWTNSGEIPGNGIDDDGNGFIDDVHGWDFLNNDNSLYDNTTCSDTSDEDFHGTHVSGIIGARRNTLGVVGVAPSVTIMPLKTIGCSGGDTTTVIDALAYAEQNGATIANMSLGGTGYDSALKAAIDASGLLVVAAAGNGGGDGVGDNNDFSVAGCGTASEAANANCPEYPASFSSANIVAVAAVDNRGTLTSFSNYGASSVDVAAPGASIISDYPNQQLTFLDGTSMATPFVTGVAALVTSAVPGISKAALKTRLLSTVRPLPSLSGRTVTGGIVDAAAAVAGSPVAPSTSSLSLTRSASTITAGSALTLSTSLSVTGSAQLRPVELQVYSGGWKRVCSVTTSATGTASCVQYPKYSAAYMWYFPAFMGQAPAWSAYRTVAVRPAISSTLSRSRVFVGQRVTWGGVVTPHRVGLTLVLQRWTGTRWAAVKSTKTVSQGKYSFSIAGSSRGTVRYRVHFAGDAGNAAQNTSVRTLSVV